MANTPTVRMRNDRGEEIVCNADEASRAMWVARGFRLVEEVPPPSPAPEVSSELELESEGDEEAATEAEEGEES